MRKRFIYDIETDGFVKDLTKIHCLVMWDIDAQELLSFRNDGHPDNLARLTEAVRMLDEAEFRAGHNIIKFDEPALAKLFPFFRPNRLPCVFDTLIAARLIWPDIAESDKGRVMRKTLPGKLIGSHSLEAWGARLFCWKGDYSVKTKERLQADRLAAGLEPYDDDTLNKLVWATWSQEMQDYCDQDVIANTKLFTHVQKKAYAARALADEMEIAVLCQKIEQNGFPFHEHKAGELYGTLCGARAGLEVELKEYFGSWVEQTAPVKTPTVGNASIGYWGEASYVWLDSGEPVPAEMMTAGGVPNAMAKRQGVKRHFEGYPYTPIKIVEFSPTSRHHIANRLKKLYGWEPSVFTPDGSPKLDEDVLAELSYPCIPLLLRYLTVEKRISQLAEGKQAWMKLVSEGRIHGSYNTVGAVTRRATHSRPNIGQVPGVQSDYGHECRELFGAPEGWWQVGTDASGLELRCLAHYMSRWDNGVYAELLLTGDVHTANQLAAGLPTRNDAKTFIYAFLYGAGDEKIGSITGGGAAAGKTLKARFLAGLPALGNLVTAVKTKAKEHKILIALDGGVLHVRSPHSALNTLLQSAGALICKKWGVMIEQELIRRGYDHGKDFLFLAWVHDEYQIAARTEALAREIGEVSQLMMKAVEAYYDFQCPLDTDFKVGKNWAECH